VIQWLLTAGVAALAAWGGATLGGSVGLALQVGAALLVCGRLLGAFASRNRASGWDEIDAMDGLEFEAFTAELLERRGWRVEVTPGSHDLGVDLVAERKGERVAVQVKRQEAPVSRRAVSDAVAGCDHYGCTGAMVVTNSYFTRGAIALAESTGCELVDRDELMTWAGRRRG
jgi:restriction system protein